MSDIRVHGLLCVKMFPVDLWVHQVHLYSTLHFGAGKSVCLLIRGLRYSFGEVLLCLPSPLIQVQMSTNILPFHISSTQVLTNAYLSTSMLPTVAATALSSQMILVIGCNSPQLTADTGDRLQQPSAHR